MRGMMRTLSVLCALAATSLLCAGSRTEDSVLVCSENCIYEYTLQGEAIRTFPVKRPPVGIADARDIVIDEVGQMFVYNGVFNVYLSRVDSLFGRTDAWLHSTFSGLSTVNNGTYGGIAAKDGFVFLTDMRTLSGGESQGIARYSLSNGVWESFAQGIDPIDLTIGLDGSLYALYPGGSPGGRFINEYSPSNLTLIRTISLADIFGHTEHRAIAVNAASEIIIADWDGDLQKISPAGVLLARTNVSTWASGGDSVWLSDVDINSHGVVVLGNAFGKVFVTDDQFSAGYSFGAAQSEVFVTFGLGAKAHPVIELFPPVLTTPSLDIVTHNLLNGRSYCTQQCTNISLSAWEDVVSFQATSATARFCLPSSASNTHLFYRTTVLPLW
jgi:hypothetical protein